MDTLAVELVIEDQKATVKLDNFGQKIRLVNSDINRLGGQQFFAGKVSTDLDALTKRAEATRNAFQDIFKTRLDNGQVGAFTREILTAQTRSRQLAADIVNIRRELANPNRTSSIAFLTGELKGAEKELDALIRKLNTVRTPTAAAPGGQFGSNGFADSFSGRLGFSGGASAIIGGFAGAAAFTALSGTKELISDIVSEAKELNVESVKLAANFEESTNALSIFAGGAGNARRELREIDRVALDTPGLRLLDAEKGYQRLRALNFEAKISQDLIRGLGTARVQSGADAGAVDRVITNLTQLTSGSGTAADVRQTIGAIPSLRGVFQRAFGTADFGDINKLAKENPDQFIKKFAAELSNAQTAQAGLNITIEKGTDAVIQAGRAYGEPFLQPLTRDVKDLTFLLNENEQTFRIWGQSVADVYNGISRTARLGGNKDGTGFSVGNGLINYARFQLNSTTNGLSETAIGTVSAFGAYGRQEREKREAEERQKKIAEGLKNGVDFNGAKYNLDPLTNTLVRISDTIKNTPSLDKVLDIEKAIKRAELLLELSNRISVAGVEQNLELNKAIAVRDAKGDALKIARETAALEVQSIREQIALSNNLAAAKIKNLSSEDFNDGKGLLIAQENAANVAKLNNQILLTQINLQQKQNEELEKAKAKVKEIEKQYLSTFDSIFQKSGADNPFVAVFSEGDKALKDLRENLKGAPREIQAIAVALQQKLNLKALLAANISNKLSVFDLQTDAANFRNPFDGDRQKKDQDEFINRFLRNNPNYLLLQNKRALDEDERQKILQRFAPSSLTETTADRFNKSLDEKFSLLYKPGQTREEIAAADKQFISLTQGANPLDLNRNLREQAAVAREREAVRQERYFQDALALDRQKLTVQQQIAANTKNQNKIAEQGGTKAIDVRVINESSNDVSAEQRPTAGDTANYYNGSLTYGNSGGLTNR